MQTIKQKIYAIVMGVVLAVSHGVVLGVGDDHAIKVTVLTEDDSSLNHSDYIELKTTLDKNFCYKIEKKVIKVYLPELCEQFKTVYNAEEIDRISCITFTQLPQELVEQCASYFSALENKNENFILDSQWSEDASYSATLKRFIAVGNVFEPEKNVAILRRSQKYYAPTLLQKIREGAATGMFFINIHTATRNYTDITQKGGSTVEANLLALIVQFITLSYLSVATLYYIENNNHISMLEGLLQEHAFHLNEIKIKAPQKNPTLD